MSVIKGRRGARLAHARRTVGLSQGQLANLMEFHRPTISEVEAGNRRVSAEELGQFAEHLDVSVGWLVGEAADGTSAINAARALRPDLVLLDVRLPDFDGFKVAERLAANGRTPAIVLTSSRDRSDFGYDIDACAADGFIPKSELSAEAIALLIR